ncbi:MAG: DUF1588 domain-containing protein, partial [Proteobacteria bacterium]|nr:DUF1588 domain-containing protein [Pseudomonadota bacterium]
MYRTTLRIRHITASIILSGSALSLAACGLFHKKESDDEASQEMPPPPSSDLTEVKSDEWWLAKANQVLRLGQSQNDVADVGNLPKLAPREAAMRLMEDKAFYDLVTDFSMYWFGTKAGSLYDEIIDLQGGFTPFKDKDGHVVKGLARETLQSLPSVFAARQLFEGKNYFESLFAEDGQIPMLSNGFAYLEILKEDGSTEPLSASTNEIRAKIVRRVDDFAAKLRSLDPTPTKEFICTEASKDIGVSFGLGSLEPRSGNYEVENMISNFSLSYQIERWCENASETDVAKGMKMVEDAGKAFSRSGAYFSKLQAQFPAGQVNAVRHVLDLKMHDYSDFGIQEIKPVKLWSFDLFEKLPNSSTNRNRKRSAWVLKRFFCDDLTPINVEAPTTSHAAQHGSDPACYSCHYKLDPMAGFFRELGQRGFSYRFGTSITFDDNASQERSVYEEPWKADPSTGREWNIGYVRSTVETKLNTYGSDFSDLLKLLKTAPEVKECFVRRVFAYSVGEEQTYDRAWGREIVARMEAQQNPLDAIKGVFA